MASERSRVTMKGNGSPVPRSAERVRGTKTPARGTKSDAHETPSPKTTSKAVAPAAKPVPPQGNPAPAKSGPVIQPVKASGAPAPAPAKQAAPAPAKQAAPAPAPAKQAAPATPPAPVKAATPTSKPVSQPVAPPVVQSAPTMSVVPKKSESSNAAPAATQAPAQAAPPAPTPALKMPGVDPAAVAAAVLAQTAPVIEAGIKRFEARVDTDANKPAAVASVVIAQATPVVEAAFKRVEARVEAAVQRVDKEVDRRVNLLEQKLAEIAKTQAQQVAAAQTEEPQSMDEELDQIARTMKRAFIESFERSSDRVALPLVKVQRYIEEISRRAAAEAPALREHLAICVTSLGAVLTDLGVETFEAESAEDFDPVIHQCVGETHRDDAASNAVVRSVAPGYRSARGQVLLPALVTVNRK